MQHSSVWGGALCDDTKYTTAAWETKGVFTWNATNSNWYEIFAAVYKKPGLNTWCLVSGRNILSNKCIADPVWELLSFKWEQYQLRMVWVLSSFWGRSPVKGKEDMYGTRYELMPVWVRSYVRTGRPDPSLCKENATIWRKTCTIIPAFFWRSIYHPRIHIP